MFVNWIQGLGPAKWPEPVRFFVPSFVVPKALVSHLKHLHYRQKSVLRVLRVHCQAKVKNFLCRNSWCHIEIWWSMFKSLSSFVYLLVSSNCLCTGLLGHFGQGTGSGKVSPLGGQLWWNCGASCLLFVKVTKWERDKVTVSWTSQSKGHFLLKGINYFTVYTFLLKTSTAWWHSESGSRRATCPHVKINVDCGASTKKSGIVQWAFSQSALLYQWIKDNFLLNSHNRHVWCDHKIPMKPASWECHVGPSSGNKWKELITEMKHEHDEHLINSPSCVRFVQTRCTRCPGVHFSTASWRRAQGTVMWIYDIELRSFLATVVP